METGSAKQDGLSDDFRQKVAKWEAAGVFDRIAAKIDEVLEHGEAVGMLSRRPPGMEAWPKGSGLHN